VDRHFKIKVSSQLKTGYGFGDLFERDSTNGKEEIDQ